MDDAVNARSDGMDVLLADPPIPLIPAGAHRALLKRHPSRVFIEQKFFSVKKILYYQPPTLNWKNSGEEAAEEITEFGTEGGAIKKFFILLGIHRPKNFPDFFYWEVGSSYVDINSRFLRILQWGLSIGLGVCFPVARRAWPVVSGTR